MLLSSFNLPYNNFDHNIVMVALKNPIACIENHSVFLQKKRRVEMPISVLHRTAGQIFAFVHFSILESSLFE